MGKLDLCIVDSSEQFLFGIHGSEISLNIHCERPLLKIKIIVECSSFSWYGSLVDPKSLGLKSLKHRALIESRLVLIRQK